MSYDKEELKDRKRIVRDLLDQEKRYVTIKQFILERFTFYSKIIFKNEDFHPILKVYTKEMMNNIIFNFVLHLYNKQQKQGVNLTTPKRWRDWIKEKHKHKKWMKLIIKKFPIKYNIHHYILNEYTTFPSLDLPLDFEKRLKLVFYDYKYEGVNIED